MINLISTQFYSYYSSRKSVLIAVGMLWTNIFFFQNICFVLFRFKTLIHQGFFRLRQLLYDDARVRCIAYAKNKASRLFHWSQVILQNIFYLILPFFWSCVYQMFFFDIFTSISFKPQSYLFLRIIQPLESKNDIGTTVLLCYLLSLTRTAHQGNRAHLISLK